MPDTSMPRGWSGDVGPSTTGSGGTPPNDTISYSTTPTTKATTIYLSGKMTGLPDFGAKEFNEYAAKYRLGGFNVVSPIELDRGVHDEPYGAYIRRDVALLLGPTIDRLYLMPSWRDSKGARLEKHLAETVGMPVFDAETGELYVENVADEAKRLVFGDRRESYNNPLSDFGRTKGIVNAVFQHKLRAEFTEEDVAIFMIAVKLSRLTNKPDHRDSLVDIIGYSLCYEWLTALREEAVSGGQKQA